MIKPEIRLKNFPPRLGIIAKQAVIDFFLKRQTNYQPVVEITVIDSRKMRRLNQRYRQQNQPSEVLSFPIWENVTSIPKSSRRKRSKIILGDILLSQSIIDDHQKIKILIEHSLNHLIGKHH